MDASIDWSCDAAGIQAIDVDAAPMPIRSEDELRVLRLIEWAKCNGAQVGALTVDTRDGHRIIRAAADVAPGTQVARIPLHLFISVAVARRSRIGQLLEARCREVSNQSYLAAFLLEVRRDGGFWSPYVDALPRAFPTHPFYFGPLELLALDPLSVIGANVTCVRKGNQTEFESIAGVLADEGFSRADFDWAHCCARTRGYHVTIEGVMSNALIPLADMLNHVNQPCTNGKRPDLCDHVITAERSIASGEEVTTTYGEHSNATLLSVYGFTLDDNEFDNACLMVGDVAYFVTTKFDDPAMRALFKAVRREMPVRLRDTKPTDGDMPFGIDHEYACLCAIHSACVVCHSRAMTCLREDDPMWTTTVARSTAGLLRSAMESEQNVLCQLMSFVDIAGRVLCARGTVAQDRAMLTYLDADYATALFELVDQQPGTP